MSLANNQKKSILNEAKKIEAGWVGDWKGFFQKVVRKSYLVIEICLSIGESQNNNGISQTGVKPVVHTCVIFYTVVTIPDVLPLNWELS